MKKKHRHEEELPPAYEGVERHLMATYYSGVYITNADLVRVAREIGLDMAMKDRQALLKDLMHHAHETGTKAQMMQGFISVLQERSKSYEQLVENFPAAVPLLHGMMQKMRSTILLLQREMRSDPYA